MHEGYLKKKRLIPILLWQSGAFESATASMFCYKLKYLLLTVQMRSFARNLSCVCVCVCVCVRETGSHHSGVYCPSEIILTTACVLQIHTSIITVSVTRLCSPLGLELIKLTWKLKLAIIERGIIFPTRACGVRPITMHWVSWPIRALMHGRRDFVGNDAFERGGAQGTYNNVPYLKNNVFFEH